MHPNTALKRLFLFHFLTPFASKIGHFNPLFSEEEPKDGTKKEKGGTYGMPQKERVKPPGARDMSMDFVPVHVAPNACCGTETYNDAMDCCVEEDGRKKVKRNQVCEESEEEGSDER